MSHFLEINSDGCSYQNFGWASILVEAASQNRSWKVWKTAYKIILRRVLRGGKMFHSNRTDRENFEISSFGGALNQQGSELTRVRQTDKRTPHPNQTGAVKVI